jgi:SPP1 gp7 family putative phage head morphogenesis protein
MIARSIPELYRMLGASEALDVIRMAKKVDDLEKSWLKRAEAVNEELLVMALEALQDQASTGAMERLLTEFLMDHMIDVTQTSYRQAQRRMPQVKGRLSVGRDLKRWMAIWDSWKTKRKPTREIKKKAQEVMREYLKATKRWWERRSEPIRRGEIPRKDLARQLASEVKAPLSRAKTIVNTETTGYYNQVRQDFYGADDNVTHFLFMAIRDHRTTKWCKTRHGLVYAKDDPLFEKERPACHWNCRSEILPLTTLSPRHQTLIQDKSRARRNNSPEPLPKGWRG